MPDGGCAIILGPLNNLLQATVVVLSIVHILSDAQIGSAWVFDISVLCNSVHCLPQ